MKIDKESLIKHKFWIACGTFLLLWLIGFTVLLVSAGEPIRQHRQDYEKAKSDAEAALSKGPKNENFFKPWREHQMLFRHHKDVIWEKAWNLQQSIYTWPESSYRLQDKMTSPLAETASMNLEERQDYMNILYKQQIDQVNFASKLAPTELAGGVDHIIRPVKWTVVPSLEECWLAQEDFWVRRDLLLGVVQVANKTLARMEPVKGPASKEEGVLKEYRCRNDCWELDLLIVQGKEQRDKVISARSTIKNIHPAKRTLQLATPASPNGIGFRISQEGNPDKILRITGEPVLYGTAVPIRVDFDLLPIDYRKPFEVEQVFDWYSVPVKRVEDIRLGHQSARTVSAPLVSNLDLPDDSEAAPAAAPGGAPGAPGGAPPPLGGPATKDAGDKPTRNGLSRNRYLQVTAQCRHLPIGLLLDVDQSCIPDVLAAVANSRLRIQVTQVQILRVHGIVPRGKKLAGQDRPLGSGRPGGAAGAPPGMRPGPAAAGGRGGSTEGGAASEARRAASADEDPNIVALAVYGIAVLYERFDPKKATGQAPGTPPAR
jgi:hypothetical protein